MTAGAVSILPPEEKTPLGRWALAAAVVLSAHLGLFYWLSRSGAPEITAAAPETAVMIDLPPMAVGQLEGGGVQAPPEQEVAPEPEVVPEPEPEPVPEPPPPVPDVKPAPKAEAVLMTPPKPKPQKPKPLAKKSIEAKRAPTRAQPRAAVAGRTGGTPGQGGGGGGGGGVGSSMSGSNWRGLVSAALNRVKRYPPGAQTGGVATIAFTVDRSGRVVSARLIRSSGLAVLDQEAVAIARRASPFPPPPPEMGGSVSLTVPVNFRQQ